MSQPIPVKNTASDLATYVGTLPNSLSPWKIASVGTLVFFINGEHPVYCFDGNRLKMLPFAPLGDA